MLIEFYEEFPNEDNLRKLKFIKFPTRIFIASKSVKEFQKYETFRLEGLNKHSMKIINKFSKK